MSKLKISLTIKATLLYAQRPTQEEANVQLIGTTLIPVERLARRPYGGIVNSWVS